MTGLHVYAGPSITAGDRAEWSGRPGVVLHPPVRRGDLLALSDGGDDGLRILIIDGEFGQSLAVAVTEIRALIRRGAWIGGASSMGALRAVECAPLGVRPFGWIAAAYAREAVTSDAEVALVYDPESYHPLSIPLINVRWMLSQLVSQGALDEAMAARALASAAGLHYRERSRSGLALTWRRELPGAARDLAAGQVAELVHGRWDRKRLDALGALTATLALADAR
jgi:TfuA protein